MLHEIEIVLWLLAAMVVLVAAARRAKIPYPLLLVIGGLLISLVPGLPPVELEPEIVFFLFLPPIITAAAYFTPIRDFRFNLRSIILLAVGLVLFTTVVVAATARAIIPDMSWAAAFALGAIVAPPDAIAATSIARRLNLPQRIITVLEGESLVNDASALVAYRVAVAAAVTGTFSLGAAAGDFLLASVGGLLVGLALGWLVTRLVAWINDTPVEIIITFLGAFAAYQAAETLHVSGVLATVALGLYVGRHSVWSMSSATRVQGQAVWDIVIFLLNGLVFILIGLQLPGVLENLAADQIGWGALLWYGLAICIAVIVARFVWMPFGAYGPRLIPAIRAVDPFPPWQNIVIVSWAGMRGIVSLAAALALPEEMPERNLIIFLTFCVILVTLLVQGLSLPWLIRRLGVADDGKIEREEDKARLVAAKAGLARLEELAAAEWVLADHVDDLRGHYEERAQRFVARYQGLENGDGEASAEAFERLHRELLQAEMAAIIRLRDAGTINDEVMRRVQRELDFERLRLERE
ncbi:MAG: Na+/H+ antiporter [Chloroflexaceae bacterium]|jgi:CPA1 family monovalent cation:H+ antiporter|nr:Na+/H+ antiporter [Chloroflexaceae bacterium]